MRRLLIATMLSLVGLAACDVDVTIRRGEKASLDAGPLAESPDPPSVAAPAVPETKPAPKDDSLKRKIGDLWNRAKDDGKELARDAERNVREIAHDAEKKGDELRKDTDAIIEDVKNVDVDVDVKKKDLSPSSWIDKIPWWGWILIVVAALVMIGGLLDALDIFEGFFEALGKLLVMLIEVLVKAAVAVAKGFVSLIAAIGKAFRPKRKKDPGKRVILIDDTIPSGGAAPPQRSPREPGEPGSWGGPDGPTRGSAYHGHDDTEHGRRRTATTKAAPPTASRDESGPGNGNGVIAVVGGVVEAVGETLGEIADAAGDIDLD